MFFANDDKGKRVNIRAADPNKMYFCPQCKDAVIQRHGTTNEHCFAHTKGYECDQWGCMSKWHNEWQMNFLDETQEVILRSDTETHRADICIHNMVIEFQGSPISNEELEKRISFYTRHGLLIFVFNELDKCINIKGSIAYWSSPSRSIVPPDNRSYFLFFQIAEDKLILVDRQLDGWSKFKIVKKYSKNEFIQVIMDNNLIGTLYECMRETLKAEISKEKQINASLHNTIAALKSEQLSYNRVKRKLTASANRIEHEKDRTINALNERIEELLSKNQVLMQVKSVEVEKIVEKPVIKVIEKEKPIYIENEYTIAKKALIEGVLNEVGRYISVAKTNDEREQLYSRGLLETNLKKVINRTCNKANILKQ